MQLAVILDNVRSVHNVGSIFRTADAVGVEKIYCCGKSGDTRIILYAGLEPAVILEIARPRNPSAGNNSGNCTASHLKIGELAH